MLIRGSTLREVIPLEQWAILESSSETPPEGAWLPIPGPSTIATALRALGLWDFRRPRAFDSETWWMRCQVPALPAGAKHVLRIGGLATIADVFLNGTKVLH